MSARGELMAALRRIAGDRFVAGVVVITVGVGLAATMAVYSIARAVLLGALAEDPDGISAVYTVDANNPGHLPVSDVTALDLRRELAERYPQSPPALALFAAIELRLVLDDQPTYVAAALVSASYFDVLDVELAHGTGFTAADSETSEPEIIVGDRFWREWLGGDPSIVGTTIELDAGTPAKVVGIAPEGFLGTHLHELDVFVPYAAHAAVVPDIPWFGKRRFLAFEVLVRRPASLDEQTLDADVAEIAEAIAQAHPAEVGGRRLRVVPFSHSVVGPDHRPGIELAAQLGGVVVLLVVVVACANATNLLLARAAARAGELALRGALGAAPWRLATSAVAEAVVLVFGAWLVAVVAAAPLRDALWALRPPDLEWARIGPTWNPAVFGASMALATTACLVIAIGPAIRAWRTDLTTPLRSHAIAGAVTPRRTRSLLIIVQIGLSFATLAGAGLLLRTASNLRRIDPGFAVDELAVFRIEGSMEALEHAVGRVLELEGVEGAALSTQLPLGHGDFRRTIEIDPSTSIGPRAQLVRVAAVTPGYFAAMGMPIVAGTTFTQSSSLAKESPAVVDRTFAELYWGDDDPIGKTFGFAGVPEPLRVVGVTTSTKSKRLDEAPLPIVHVPLGGWSQATSELVVRGDDPQALRDAVMKRLADDDGVTISKPRLYTEDRDAVLGPLRSGATWLATFGAIAVGLATLGVFTVVGASTAQRTREIGIRGALGAAPRRIARQFAVEAAVVAAIGIGLGLVGGAAMHVALAEHTVGVALVDPPTTAIVSAIVLVCVHFATWLAVRRTVAVPPAVALRRR
jgi:predicted permease